ncbi:hypothetical protein J6W78_04385 [bacterium]|nr:hypothetical protein [bacterium]
MTKKQAIKALESRARLILEERKLDERCGEIFCGISSEDEIHISGRERAFLKITEAIQPVVVYNPNFGKKLGGRDLTEAYFYIDIYARRWKVFALLDPAKKQGVLDQIAEEQKTLLESTKVWSEYIDKHGDIY